MNRRGAAGACNHRRGRRRRRHNDHYGVLFALSFLIIAVIFGVRAVARLSETVSNNNVLVYQVETSI